MCYNMEEEKKSDSARFFGVLLCDSVFTNRKIMVYWLGPKRNKFGLKQKR